MLLTTLRGRLTTGRCLHELIFARRNYGGTAGDFRAELMKYQYGSVDLTKDDQSGVAKIKINHPERKNAISGSMMCDLADIASELENWTEGKGFLLYGSDKTFCSGGDLKSIGKEPEKGKKMSAFMHQVMVKLRNLPMLSVALVQGRALGGGSELTLTCDFRLFTPKAKIGFVQSRLAIAPGWGGACRLVDVVGQPTALELLCSGKVITATEALDCKLANGITEDEDNAEEYAMAWLAERITPPAETVHVLKKMVLNGSQADLVSMLERENELFGSVWGAPRHLEALEKGIKHK